MIKKIIFAMAFIAVSSFATWDKFPVLDANKGQVKAGLAYGFHDEWKNLDVNVGARYTIIPNLELMIDLPYRIFGQWDGDDVGDGLGNVVVGGRYWFPNHFGLFLDAIVPIGDDSWNYQGFGAHFGGQYSNVLGNGFSFGSELGLQVNTEGDNNYWQGVDLNLGGELDYTIPQMTQLTPYLGLDIYDRIIKSTYETVTLSGETEDVDLDDDNMGLQVTFGVSYLVSPMFSVSGQYAVYTGDYFGDGTNVISATAYFKF